MRHAEGGLTPVSAFGDWQDYVKGLLGQLRASKKAEKMGAAEAEQRMLAMLEELADIPPDILADAIKQARLSPDEWFPTGGKLRAYAAPELNRRKLRAMRLKEWGLELKQREEKAKAHEDEPISEADRKWLQDFLERNRNGGKVAPTRPSGTSDPSDPPEGIDKETWARMIAAQEETKR